MHTTAWYKKMIVKVDVKFLSMMLKNIISFPLFIHTNAKPKNPRALCKNIYNKSTFTKGNHI